MQEMELNCATIEVASSSLPVHLGCFPASLTPLGRLSTSSQVVFPFTVIRDGLITRSKRFPGTGTSLPVAGT